MRLSVEVGVGEFLDKYSILEIKANKIADPLKLNNVLKERNMLSETFTKVIGLNSGLSELYKQLFHINDMLWNVEDRLRKLEKDKDFGELFVQTARLVYNYNDIRADIKKEINMSVGSAIIEEKSYEKYQ